MCGEHKLLRDLFGLNSVDTTFDGPQYHDILAAQHMYGDAREKTNAGLGNDTAARANPLGTVSVGNTASIGNSARTLVVAATSTDFVSIDSSTDIDFYSFTVANAVRVNVLLEALGFSYNLTVQSGAGDVAFDTRLRSDLTLTLLGTNGTTVLLSVNANGLGGNETLTFDLPAGGTYFLRITGVDNADVIALDSQFYGLTVTPVPEPTSVFLVASIVGVGGWSARRRFGQRAKS